MASSKSMDMITSIAAATVEQSAVSDQVSSSVEQISANGTRQTESAAEQIQGRARHLAELSDELKVTASWIKVA